MSLLDDASLVVVPSGYKAGTVYSVKPTNGDGDLSFTRSNDTATRVNSAGLIEKVRTNEIFPSDTTNTGWSVSGVGTFTITQNLTGQQDPNGGTTGFRFAATIGSTISDRAFFRKGVVTTSDTRTLSFWVKSANGSAQTVAFQFGGGTPQTISVTNDWQRVEYTAVTSAITNFFGVEVRGTVTDLSCDLFLYGFQLELSDFGATDYIPTTSAAVSVGMLANVPRLDYSGGGCPKLLLEPQRTNLVTFSEQLDNAAWNKSNSTITANALNSPDGYVNADKLITNNAATNGQVNQTISKAASATTYTISAFAKKSEWNQSNLYISDLASFSNRLQAFFNIETGTLIQANAFGTFTAASGKIEDYGNGWYRISATVTTSTETSIVARIYSTDSVATVGDGTSGIYVWGAQVEVGSYSTSYIPTLSAAVTRGADECIKTGISSLIGQTEGTIYLEADIQKYNESLFYIAISDGSVLGDAIYLQQTSSGNLVFLVRKTGNPNGSINVLNANWNAGFNKVAIAYTATTAEVFINGVTKGTTSFVSAPTCSKFTLAARPDVAGQLVGSGGYKQALLFTTRLSNTQLAELTTL